MVTYRSSKHPVIYNSKLWKDLALSVSQRIFQPAAVLLGKYDDASLMFDGDVDFISDCSMQEELQHEERELGEWYLTSRYPPVCIE